MPGGSHLSSGQCPRGPEGLHRLECRDGPAASGDHREEGAAGRTVSRGRAVCPVDRESQCRGFRLGIFARFRRQDQRLTIRAMMKSIAIGLCGLSIVALSAGCGRSGGSSRDQTLIYAQSEDPKTLDPINTDIAESVHVITNVFDTL